jgi:peptide methionine sulfoxide reductase msrA/msrB
MKSRILQVLSVALIINLIVFGCNMGQSDKKNAAKVKQNVDPAHLETAIFAGGCFWCMEPPYDDLPGVISTTVGYTGGKVPNPTYEEVSTGTTGHAEAVKIVFDSTKTSYRQLLQVFWRNIDPTNPFGQFADRGSQYRTAVFYLTDRQKEEALRSKKELEESGKFKDPIVTQIVKASEFYPAEEYHQEFYKKNPLRYNSYKVGSGRAGFLKKTWGDSAKTE